MNRSDAPDRRRARGDDPLETVGSAPVASPASPPDPDGDDVRAAIRAVRRGDVEAFAFVVRIYQRRLFGLALMLTREPGAAEEVAQDAFVRAFTRLDAYDERRPFYPWLATIAVRLAQNWLSQRMRTLGREARVPPANADSPSAADPLEVIIADEHSRQLWRQVAALPPGERAAAILYYRQEMTVRDIARALGVTSGTVKTLLFRARRRLRQTAAGAAAIEEER